MSDKQVSQSKVNRADRLQTKSGVAHLRRPVVGEVLRLLQESGRTEYERIIGYTYEALAAAVYEVEEPTAAQRSAVRRAVAKLVAKGLVERDPERIWPTDHNMSWLISLQPQIHWRTDSYGEPYAAYDPGGVAIYRVPTEEDRAAQAARAGEAKRNLEALERELEGLMRR